MTAAAPASPLQSLVVARIGALHLAVPAPWVAGALVSDAPLGALPRRQGALAGLLATARGAIPVVELSRWVDLPASQAPAPAAGAASPPCYLTLQQDGRRLAVQVDELLGLRRMPADRLKRLHHHDDPEELFDAVLPGAGPDDPVICVLEPARLMQLLAVWCEGEPQAQASHTPGMAAPGPCAAPTARLALVRAGSQRLAVDLQHVAELLPLPALKTRLAAGGASAGFADWRGGTLPVLHNGWLQGRPAATTAPLALALSDGSSRAIALPVDEVLGMTTEPPDALPAAEGEPAWRGPRWTDAEGPVEALQVPALLDALPESALAQRGARTTGDTRSRNEQPYFLVKAGHTAALPIGEVLAVVETQGLADSQQTLDWRGRQLPLRGLPTAGGVVVVLQSASHAVALRVEQLLGLVPAGAGELNALPGAGGARMLHLPSQAASYAVSSAEALLRA